VLALKSLEARKTIVNNQEREPQTDDGGGAKKGAGNLNNSQSLGFSKQKRTRRADNLEQPPGLVGWSWLFAVFICLNQAVYQSALAQPVQTPRPKLVVFLIADEFPYDYLARFQDKLPAGGLRSLMETGACFTHCRFEQATTQTAVGQSVIATGAHPWATGIVGDNWYDRKRGKVISASFGGEGTSSGNPHQMVGTTLGDELKLASGGRSKVFSVGIKDSAPILFNGKLGNNAFWWDARVGSFVGASPSSTPPPGGGPGDVPTDINSPRANQLVADFAKQLITQENLGQDSEPDLISINFSATEAVTNHHGPHSQESEDLVLKLDQTINGFLSFLDQKIGLNNCLIVFTADHGVAPIPELLKEKGAEAGRIDPKYFRTQLNSALAARLGNYDWIEEFEPPNLYLNLNTIDRQQRRQPDIEALTAKLAHSLPGTGEVYSAFQFFMNQLPNGPLSEAIRKSYFWGRSGELFIAPKPGYIFTAESEGTISGSPFAYDGQVPLILKGSAIKAGHYTESASPADIAPTVAASLGIAAPSMAEGRVLSEAFGQSGGAGKSHYTF
jgi:predicted AlkP superfamily pyrophosphatase or phosphodiesterase